VQFRGGNAASDRLAHRRRGHHRSRVEQRRLAKQVLAVRRRAAILDTTLEQVLAACRQTSRPFAALEDADVGDAETAQPADQAAVRAEPTVAAVLEGAGTALDEHDRVEGMEEPRLGALDIDPAAGRGGGWRCRVDGADHRSKSAVEQHRLRHLAR